VLVYYAITNLSALRLPRAQRLYPRWIAVVGLVGCALLAFWVEPRFWLVGMAIIVLGLVWKTAANRLGTRRRPDAADA
jgi:APA family basic amino acid/polyamine antiporter